MQNYPDIYHSYRLISRVIIASCACKTGFNSQHINIYPKPAGILVKDGDTFCI